MRCSWKSVVFAVLVVVGGAAVLWSPEIARGVDYTPVTISQLEENNDIGSSHWVDLHPTTDFYPVEFVGVVVNKPADMLNYTYDAVSNPLPAFQVYVQALSGGTYGGHYVAPGDFGGTAVYMRKQKGDQIYSPEEWAGELTRIGASTLNAGNVVLVQAKAPGLFYNGKYNINEQHKVSSDYDFSITVLGQAEATAASISLSDLKDGNDNFIFNYTREDGCEHYQGSLVHLDNLLLDSGTWGLGNTVTVSQEGRTFPMLLGLDSDLLSVNPGSNPFSVTAILDQESADWQAGYRLWLTSASMVPEPGSLVLLAMAGLVVLLFGWRRIVRCLLRSSPC